MGADDSHDAGAGITRVMLENDRLRKGVRAQDPRGDDTRGLATSGIDLPDAGTETRRHRSGRRCMGLMFEVAEARLAAARSIRTTVPAETGPHGGAC